MRHALEDTLVAGAQAVRRTWAPHFDRIANQAATQVLPAVLEKYNGGPEALHEWHVTNARRTENRVCVAALTRRGRRELFVKVASGPSVALQLFREAFVLMNLQLEIPTGGGLLPRLIAVGEVGAKRYIAMQALEGWNAEQLARTSLMRERGLILAASAIGDIHNATAGCTRIDADLVAAWSESALESVYTPLIRSTSLEPRLNRVRERLARGLEGRSLRVGHVHGDFWLGNVLITPDAARVTGIVDWEAGAPKQLQLTDVLHLLLCSRAATQGGQLGDVVRGLLDGDPWLPHEWHVLEQSAPELLFDRELHTAALLLAWLRHASENFSQAGGYANNRTWMRRNVLQVLGALHDARATRSTSPISLAAPNKSNGHLRAADRVTAKARQALHALDSQRRNAGPSLPNIASLTKKLNGHRGAAVQAAAALRQVDRSAAGSTRRIRLSFPSNRPMFDGLRVHLRATVRPSLPSIPLLTRKLSGCPSAAVRAAAAVRQGGRSLAGSTRRARPFLPSGLPLLEGVRAHLCMTVRAAAAGTSRLSTTPLHFGEMARRSLIEKVMAARRLCLPTVQAHAVPLASMALVALAIGAWLISLPRVDARAMTDAGLISVLPPSFFAALVLLATGFALALRRADVWRPLLLVHVVVLALILYGTPALVEEVPRFAVTWRHVGIADYVARRHSVNPNIDAYFNWPAFFGLLAFVDAGAGLKNALGFAAWAPLALNLLYLGPLLLIFRRTFMDRRLVWLAVWFFYLANWVGQDYLSPQGLSYFLYLVLLAVLLRWFVNWSPRPYSSHTLSIAGRASGAWIAATAVGRLAWARFDRLFAAATGAGVPRVTRPAWRGRPSSRGRTNGTTLRAAQTRLAPWCAAHVPGRLLAQPRPIVQEPASMPSQLSRLQASARPGKRTALAAIAMVLLATLVPMHQLTPFAALAAVSALVGFGLCRLRGLPLLGVVLITTWMFFMANGFLAGHFGSLAGDVGNVEGAVGASVATRVSGSSGHFAVVLVRLLLTGSWWLLAIAGAARARRARQTILPYAVLALAPFPLLALQSYGGEILLRIYLFSAPFAALFVAALFQGRINNAPTGSSATRWRDLTLVGLLSVALATGVLVARYGNERMDAFTKNEVNAVSTIYDKAPPGSLIVAGSSNMPWKFRAYEDYRLIRLTATKQWARLDESPHSLLALVQALKTMTDQASGDEEAYVILTASQQAEIDLLGEGPRDAIPRLRAALTSSPAFTQILANRDAAVFVRRRRTAL
jgi:hypothetical protein